MQVEKDIRPNLQLEGVWLEDVYVVRVDSGERGTHTLDIWDLDQYQSLRLEET